MNKSLKNRPESSSFHDFKLYEKTNHINDRNSETYQLKNQEKHDYFQNITCANGKNDQKKISKEIMINTPKKEVDFRNYFKSFMEQSNEKNQINVENIKKNTENESKFNEPRKSSRQFPQLKEPYNNSRNDSNDLNQRNSLDNYLFYNENKPESINLYKISSFISLLIDGRSLEMDSSSRKYEYNIFMNANNTQIKQYLSSLDNLFSIYNGDSIMKRKNSVNISPESLKKSESLSKFDDKSLNESENLIRLSRKYLRESNKSGENRLDLSLGEFLCINCDEFIDVEDMNRHSRTCEKMPENKELIIINYKFEKIKSALLLNMKRETMEMNRNLEGCLNILLNCIQKAIGTNENEKGLNEIISDLNEIWRELHFYAPSKDCIYITLVNRIFELANLKKQYIKQINRNETFIENNDQPYKISLSQQNNAIPLNSINNLNLLETNKINKNISNGKNSKNNKNLSPGFIYDNQQNAVFPKNKQKISSEFTYDYNNNIKKETPEKRNNFQRNELERTTEMPIQNNQRKTINYNKKASFSPEKVDFYEIKINEKKNSQIFPINNKNFENSKILYNQKNENQLIHNDKKSLSPIQTQITFNGNFNENQQYRKNVKNIDYSKEFDQEKPEKLTKERSSSKERKIFEPPSTFLPFLQQNEHDWDKNSYDDHPNFYNNYTINYKNRKDRRIIFKDLDNFKKNEEFILAKPREISFSPSRKSRERNISQISDENKEFKQESSNIKKIMVAQISENNKENLREPENLKKIKSFLQEREKQRDKFHNKISKISGSEYEMINNGSFLKGDVNRRKRFIELTEKLKEKMYENKKINANLISNTELYEECQNNQIHENNWEGFVKQKFKNTY